MSIRILLADDHALMREGLRSLIEKQPDREIVAEAENGRTTVELALKLRPDLVIMDIVMPDLNGIDATRKILAKAPGLKIIALSMYSDRRYVAGMLSAGASGFLLKKNVFSELERAITTVLGNQVYLCPEVAAIVKEDYVHHLPDSDAKICATLTDREREVLQLLAEGNISKQIAARLGISIKTVEMHRQHIMEKLDLHSVADLTKYAVREGLTSLDS